MAVPIVLQLGSRTAAMGFAGEPRPRLESDLSRYSVETGPFHAEFAEHAISDTLARDTPASHGGAECLDLQQLRVLFYPDLLTFTPLSVYKACFRRHLSHILNDVFKRLCVDSADVRASQVFVLEDPLCSKWYKLQITDLLLRSVGVSSVVLLPESVMSLLAAGVSSGIVLDCGWNYLRCEAIYDGRRLDNYTIFSKRAGSSVHYSRAKSSGDPFAVVESDIERDHASEVLETLFAPDGDSDDLSAPTLVQQMVSSLPIDTRKELRGNIVVSGGLSHLPSFRTRLEEALPDYQFVYTLGAWTGASLYASTTFPKHRPDSIGVFKRM